MAPGNTTVAKVNAVEKVNTPVVGRMEIDVENKNVEQEGGAYCYTINNKARTHYITVMHTRGGTKALELALVDRSPQSTNVRGCWENGEGYFIVK